MYSYISCVISWLAFIAGIAALLYFYSNYNNRGDTVTIKFKKGRYGIHFLYSGPEKVKTSNSNKKY